MKKHKAPRHAISGTGPQTVNAPAIGANANRPQYRFIFHSPLCRISLRILPLLRI